MGSFSFENQGMNTYLVYSADDDITFDTLSLGMLTNNKIEGLIPVVYSQLDNTRFLRYNITSKISLQQYFQGVIKRDQFVKVMYSLAKTMGVVREYMIPEQSIILDTDRIYVDISDSSAYMICLPILNKNTNVDMANFLKNIILSITFDEKEDCSYVTKVINYLNSSNNLALEEFENILLDLAHGRQSEKLNGNVTVQQNPVNNGMNQNFAQNPVNNGMNQNFAQNQSNNVINQNFAQNPVNNGVMPNIAGNNPVSFGQNNLMNNPGSNIPNTNIAQKNPVPNMQGVQNQANANKKEKKKLFGGKKKNEPAVPVNVPQPTKAPNNVKKNKSGIMGMQIPGVKNQSNKANNAMGDMKIPGQQVEFNSKGFGNKAPAQQMLPQQAPAQQMPPQQTPAQQMPPQQAPAQQMPPQQAPAQQMPPQQAPAQQMPPQQAPIQQMPPQQAPIQQMPPQQTPAQPNWQLEQMSPQVKAGETAVLSSSSYQETLKPTLIRAKDGSRYTITQSILKIGREADYVDYCIKDNVAVGRCHANIITRDSQYYIVDNNSKNHTYVDGRMVAPGEEILLSNGVKIMFANEEFEFKLL